MAHIYVYSPSGAVIDRAAFRRGVKRLQAQGHEVEVDPDALTRLQRFAGDDDTRLAAIERAAASGADVALISRGGYGLTRLLPRIPWKKLADASKKGTRFVGFSDFTVVQLGLLAKHGDIVTWAGPALCEGFGQANTKTGEASITPDEIMQACFDDMLAGAAEGTGWRLPAGDRRTLQAHQGELLVEQAPLWGGNLAMVTSLLQTPWWPQIKGGVLFLEDVGEHPYRIERMLLQLLYAGVIDQQKALVLGQFSNYALNRHDRGFNLARAIDYLRSKTRVPIISNLPFGHVPTKVLLPVGARVDVVINDREALVLWGHLH